MTARSTEMTAWQSVKRLLLDRKVQVPAQENPTASLSEISEVIDLGDFRIDTVERKAKLNGRQLPLTCEEFDVLVFLVTHPQRLVTRRTLLTTSWNVQDLHQTEFLRNLLSLGRKLDIAGAGKQYLRTEPWVIYRFDPGSSFAMQG